jgi:MFS family permease
MFEKQSSIGCESSPTVRTGGLTLLFALAYVSHGVSAQFGIIAQPLQYFMMNGLHLTADQVSSYLAIMMLPWVLKPFYGLACDFVPLLGYRRKSYMFVANLATAAAFVLMLGVDDLHLILIMLLISAVGMAASTAVTVGLAVEGGRNAATSRRYFAEQTFFYYSALMLASVVGGFLCHHYQPSIALHTAAAIAIVPPLVVAGSSLLLIKEKKSKFDLAELRMTGAALRQLLRSPAVWLVALFIFCWDFSPSFGVALYFHESKTLQFSQSLIGQLGAWNAAGMVIGAIFYRVYFARLGIRRQLMLAVLSGAVSTLAYLMLSSDSAIALELVRGFTNMLAILSIYALAADVCPPRMEVSLMATQIAVRNLATDGSTFLGGHLYANVFNNHIAPLIVVSAATTALCALLVMLLPRGDTAGKPED